MAKDMRGLLDSFESETTEKHEEAVGAAVGRKKTGHKGNVPCIYDGRRKEAADREGAGTWLKPVCVLPAGCG